MLKLICLSFLSATLIFLQSRTAVAMATPTASTSSDQPPMHGQCQGQENSYLWRIHTSPPIFLFGTMHVPYTQLWQHIPENVKTAFSSSEELCLELQLLDSDTVSELSRCRLLPEGQALESVLSGEIIARVASYLERIKELLPIWTQQQTGNVNPLFGGVLSSEQLFNSFIGNWQKVRPVWLLYLLSSLTEQRTRLSDVPVIDTFLEQAAHSLGKDVQAIEQVEDQCRPLNRLRNEQVELALRVQLDYLETLVAQPDFNGPQSSLEENINAYRCGDFAYRVNHTPLLPLPPLANLTTTSPYVKQEELSMLSEAEGFLNRQMVVKRNRKMAQQIEKLLGMERNKTFFLGLGAGHYLSEKNSVITRLRRKGYEVEHIPANQLINGSSLPNNIIELGDPNSVPRLLIITPSEAPPSPSHGSISSLSPGRLEEIFGHNPSQAPPTLTTPTASNHVTLSSERLAEIFGHQTTSSSQRQSRSVVSYHQARVSYSHAHLTAPLSASIRHVHSQQLQDLEQQAANSGSKMPVLTFSVTLLLVAFSCLLNFELSSL